MARKSFSDFNFSLLDIPKLFVDKGKSGTSNPLSFYLNEYNNKPE